MSNSTIPPRYISRPATPREARVGIESVLIENPRWQQSECGKEILFQEYKERILAVSCTFKAGDNILVFDNYRIRAGINTASEIVSTHYNRVTHEWDDPQTGAKIERLLHVDKRVPHIKY